MGNKSNKEAIKKQLRYLCSINNYIIDEYSICREERQYALYLHNILMMYRDPEVRLIKMKNDDRVYRVFKACCLCQDLQNGTKDIELKHVWYEASLMRDFFMRNRELYIKYEDVNDLTNRLLKMSRRDRYDKEGNRQILVDTENSFNSKLIDYISEHHKEYKDTINKPEDNDFEEVNYGHNNDDVLIRNFKSSKTGKKVKRMMNAKPDIAVIFKAGVGTHLHFIECKFESPVAKKDDEPQDELQYEIADFLCEKIFEKKIKVSPFMNDHKKSRVVHFTRDERQKEKDGYIWIKDLIELNNEIFGM